MFFRATTKPADMTSGAGPERTWMETADWVSDQRCRHIKQTVLKREGSSITNRLNCRSMSLGTVSVGYEEKTYNVYPDRRENRIDQRYRLQRKNSTAEVWILFVWFSFGPTVQPIRWVSTCFSVPYHDHQCIKLACKSCHEGSRLTAARSILSSRGQKMEAQDFNLEAS